MINTMKQQVWRVLLTLLLGTISLISSLPITYALSDRDNGGEMQHAPQPVQQIRMDETLHATSLQDSAKQKNAYLKTTYAQADIEELTIGYSTLGKPITAVRIGNGPRKLVVVGNTHGGPEANTHQLAQQLLNHFRTHPTEVPSEIRLYIIPTINPDGLELNSRFNAMGVDLNRNMNSNLDACPENDWGKTVNGAYGMISDTGGPFIESEGESRIIRDFLLDASGVIFLHCNAGLVFPAFCEHPPSIQMAEIYAHAAGYHYERIWENYVITGGMHDWAGSLGIAAIVPELISATDSEFAPNLAGLRAVMEHPEELLPYPKDHMVGNFVVPAIIWRYWLSHGGEQVFGVPLQPAKPTEDGMIQTFTNARLELRSSLADTRKLVQPIALGNIFWQHMGEQISASQYNLPDEENPNPQDVVFSLEQDEQYTMYGTFLDYWNRNSGEQVFGYPITPEFTGIAADGYLRTLQYFERGAFAYYPEDGSVRPEPLGWRMMMFEHTQDDWIMPRVR